MRRAWNSDRAVTTRGSVPSSLAGRQRTPLLGYKAHTRAWSCTKPHVSTEQFHRDQNFLEVTGSIPTAGDVATDRRGARGDSPGKRSPTAMPPTIPVTEPGAVAYLRDRQGRRNICRGGYICYERKADATGSTPGSRDETPVHAGAGSLFAGTPTTGRGRLAGQPTGGTPWSPVRPTRHRSRSRTCRRRSGSTARGRTTTTCLPIWAVQEPANSRC